MPLNLSSKGNIMIKVSSNFDNGSIIVVDESSAENIVLRLKSDSRSEHKQWFHFEVQGPIGLAHNIKIEGVSKSSFPNGWKGYQVVASYDNEDWFRVDTSFDGEDLVFNHTPSSDKIRYAYFAPYPHSRRRSLESLISESKIWHKRVVGFSVKNQPMNVFVLGDECKSKRNIWITAGQHPGEQMGLWFVDGIVRRLIGDNDLAKEIVSKSNVYIVQELNPDGIGLGNHRTNANGLDLNRQWHEPDPKDCPEVYFVKKEMEKVGVDFLLDVHGDEEIPYNFIMSGGNSCKLSQLTQSFKQELLSASNEFQLEYDYNTFTESGGSCCGSSCSKQQPKKLCDFVADKFGCPAMLLEMPFKDNLNNIDEKYGWSGLRSLRLGEASIEAINRYFDKH